MIRRVFPFAVAVSAVGTMLWTATVWSMRATGPANERPCAAVPVLALDGTTRVLTPAPRGTRLTTRFTLENAGTGPLRLKYLQSSCGCVEAKLLRTEIPPGESADLEAQVLVPQVGRRKTSIQFFTNASAGEPVTLTVVAQSDVAVPYVSDTSDPGVVFNGWLTPGACRTTVLRTIEKKGSAPWLGRFEVDLPCVSVQLLDVAEAPSPDESDEIERTYRLEFSLSGKLPTSRVQGRFLAFAAQQGAVAAAGPVLIDPAKPVELSPPAVYVTRNTAIEPRAVYVRSTQPNFDLECSVQRPLPDGVQVQPGGQSNGTYEFLISLADRAALQTTAASPARCEIVFLTNHPEMRKLTLPVVLRR